MKKQKLKPKAKPQKPKKAESGSATHVQDELIYHGVSPCVKALYVQSGFDRNFHPENFLAQLRQGHTPAEVAASWGISMGQLNEWVETYPELAQARAIGATAFEAFYKKALRLSSFYQLRVRENSLFKLLDNQLGYGDGGGHEFSDQSNAELVFIDPKDPKA